MKHEKRLFEIELRGKGADGNGGATLRGYAAIFNRRSDNLGGFYEIVKPGAFSQAIETSDVRALYNHNSNILPLGRTPDTLRLSEDDKGLLVEIDLPDTQFARDLAVSIERGDISQMSFSFSLLPDGDDWEELQDGTVIRTLKKVATLYDVSPVVYPAYPDTDIAVRALDTWRKRVERRGAPGRRMRNALRRREISHRSMK